MSKHLQNLSLLTTNFPIATYLSRLRLQVGSFSFFGLKHLSLGTVVYIWRFTNNCFHDIDIVHIEAADMTRQEQLALQWSGAVIVTMLRVWVLTRIYTSLLYWKIFSPFSSSLRDPRLVPSSHKPTASGEWWGGLLLVVFWVASGEREREADGGLSHHLPSLLPFSLNVCAALRLFQVSFSFVSMSHTKQQLLFQVLV